MAQQKRIYLDHGAATPMDPSVLEAMTPFWSGAYGNGGALHSEGRAAKAAIEHAREQCAHAAHAHADEIIFTSGGTEGNNFAIFGVVHAVEKTGKNIAEMHFITTPIEHSSVRDCFETLGEAGADITYLPVSHDGLVDPQDVQKNLKPNTVLVSVMYVNNEIGTILPIEAIGKVVKVYRTQHDTAYPIFHSDACQAPAYVHIDVEKLGVDLLTVDAQKLYGPKGAGYLYCRRSTSLAPLMLGGNQERGMRPGTPVTPLVVGLGRAIELAEERRKSDVERLTELRDYFIQLLANEIPEAVVNGSTEYRVANNVNISIPGLDAEFMLLQLDLAGIAISTRSACLFGTEGGSYVVRAMGKGLEYATSSIRLTLGRQTTREEINTTVETLKDIIALAKESANLGEVAQQAMAA